MWETADGGDIGHDRDRRAHLGAASHSYLLRSMGCLRGKTGAGSKPDEDDVGYRFPKRARDLSDAVIDFGTSAAHQEGVVREKHVILPGNSATGVFSAEEEAAILKASGRKHRLKPHVCTGGRRVQSGGKTMLELSQEIGVTRVDDGINWEDHPFSYAGDDRIAYEAYLQFNRHLADLQVTRALLQQKSWKASKVHSDENNGTCLYLTRFDGLKFTVCAKSHNRLCAIFENNGLILGQVDSIQRNEGKFVVLFHRVHSTKAAVIQVATEADLVIAQGCLGGIHPLTHTFRGRRYLQRLLVLEKHSLKYPDMTFHPGKKLYRINAENIVSEVGWVPENYELETTEVVKRQLGVGCLFGDINWVYLGDSFNDEPTERDQVNCFLCL